MGWGKDKAAYYDADVAEDSEGEKEVAFWCSVHLSCDAGH